MPDLPVLVVSMHDEALYAERALRAGARGYVMKRAALDSDLQAVRSVIEGEIYISPSMTKRMLFDHIHSRGEARSAVARLTDRELEVFEQIGQGHDMVRNRAPAPSEQKNRRSAPGQRQGEARGGERARGCSLRRPVGEPAVLSENPRSFEKTRLANRKPCTVSRANGRISDLLDDNVRRNRFVRSRTLPRPMAGRSRFSTPDPGHLSQAAPERELRLDRLMEAIRQADPPRWRGAAPGLSLRTSKFCETRSILFLSLWTLDKTKSDLTISSEII